jgi:hypothetical protein
MKEPEDIFPRQHERDSSSGQTGTQNLGGSRSDIGQPRERPPDAPTVVQGLLDALNRGDYDAARGMLSDGMTFVGVLGTREGADAYIGDMKRMRLKYDVQKIFTSGDDVCVFSNLKISGVSIFCSSWYHVTDGKIDSLRVVFDPRPVLEQSRKH